MGNRVNSDLEDPENDAPDTDNQDNDQLNDESEDAPSNVDVDDSTGESDLLKRTPQQLAAYIRKLRKENKGRRQAETTLNTQLEEAKQQLADAEGKIAGSTGNAKELLAAKDAEISRLKSEIKDKDAKIGEYAELSEARREAIINTFPETLRDKYRNLNFSAEQLEAIRAGMPKKKASDNKTHTEERLDDTDLETALASNDDDAFNAAFDKRLKQTKK